MILATTMSRAAKKSIATMTTKLRRIELPVLLKRTHGHSISTNTFLREKKIRNYFYGVDWMSYESEWVEVFIFYFWMSIIV